MAELSSASYCARQAHPQNAFFRFRDGYFALAKSSSKAPLRLFIAQILAGHKQTNDREAGVYRQTVVRENQENSE